MRKPLTSMLCGLVGWSGLAIGCQGDAPRRTSPPTTQPAPSSDAQAGGAAKTTAPESPAGAGVGLQDAASPRTLDAIQPQMRAASDAMARASVDATSDLPPRPMLPAGVLFMDGFQAGDITDWKVGAGNWTLCPNGARMAYCQSDLGQAVSLVGDPTWTDYDVRVTVTVNDTAALARPELIFRATSDTKYWAVQVFVDAKFGPSIEVASHSNGSSGHAGGSAFSFKPNTPFPLHVRAVGKVLTVYYANDKDTFPLTVSGLPTAGRVGLGSKGTAVEFSDFKVTKL